MPKGSGQNPMSKADSSRIQSSQAKAGHDTGSKTFAARAQSAGDRNTNAGGTGGALGGGGGRSSQQSSSNKQ